MGTARAADPGRRSSSTSIAATVFAVRTASTWALTRRQCVYCANGDDRFLVAAPDVDRPGRRVELCGACGCYTKAVDAPSLTPFPLIAIEDLATMDLDEGAMARGYHRPDLFDLDTIEPPPTPNCG